MPSEYSSDVRFEIGHVLFIDIVGYSPAAEIVLPQVEAQVGNVDDTIAALPSCWRCPTDLRLEFSESILPGIPSAKIRAFKSFAKRSRNE